MAQARGGHQEENQQRLDEVLASYLRACDSGKRPDRRALLAKYPDLATQLTEYFQVEDAIEGLLEADRRSNSSHRAGESRSSGSTAVLNGSARESADAAPASGPFSPQDQADLGRFGDYVLLEELGRGRLGVVFRAIKRGRKQASALKLILSSYEAKPEEIDRFRAQMQAVAEFDHPGFVPIERVGERLGLHYVAMGLARGGSLASQLPHYQADREAAALVVTAVAHALQDAHKAGLIHGYISPSNVLLDAEGHPLIADLGMSAWHVRAGDASPYFAPDHLQPAPQPLAATTDVYGLGGLLYALLSERDPFRGRSASELRKRIAKQKPRPPIAAASAHDRDLNAVCLKCLQKQPADRYGSCLEVAEELERWLRGQPVLARRRFGFWNKDRSGG